MSQIKESTGNRKARIHPQWTLDIIIRCDINQRKLKICTSCDNNKNRTEK